MTRPTDPTSSQPPPDVDEAGPAREAERREALRRLGPLAAMTSATLVSLLVSTRASAESPPLDP